MLFAGTRICIATCDCPTENCRLMLLANPGLKSTGWNVCEIKLISPETTTTTTTTLRTIATSKTTTRTPGPPTTPTTTATVTRRQSTFAILRINNFFHLLPTERDHKSKINDNKYTMSSLIKCLLEKETIQACHQQDAYRLLQWPPLDVSTWRFMMSGPMFLLGCTSRGESLSGEGGSLSREKPPLWRDKHL